MLNILSACKALDRVVPPLTDVNATGRKITINGTLSAFAEYKISQPRVLGLR